MTAPEVIRRNNVRSILDDDIAKRRADDPDAIDPHRNAPKADPAMFYGMVGEVARLGSENTEANPVAVAMSFMVFLAASIGRGPVLHVGDDWHHVRLFGLHVGRSGLGRKGTAMKLMKRISKAVKAKELQPAFGLQIHDGGLSSREGLALLIHDKYYEGKEEIPAIHDKRLLVIESEFANILHQSKRDGNTLSPALRGCWDGEAIKPATKTNRMWASWPHVNLLANITPSELLELMTRRELTNGFANRFVIYWAEQPRVLPFPRPTPQADVDRIADNVIEVLTFAGADRWVDRDVLDMELAPGDATALYAKLYRTEFRDRSGGERVTGLLERAAPMVLRMAMLFALTDKTTRIEAQHIEAAAAWVRYWRDSVKFIFQTAADELATAQTSARAAQILAYLNQHGDTSRSDLSVKCFQKHASRDEIDAALDELLKAIPPAIRVESIPRADGAPGKATKVYSVHRCEVSELSEIRGLAQ